MFELELTERSLIVHLRGIYRFLALRRRVACALAHVRAVSPGIAPALTDLPVRATRKAGSRLPGRLIIGSFGYARGAPAFFALRSGERALTIELEQERYAALVLEVEDPAGLASTIAAAAERARAVAGGGGS